MEVLTNGTGGPRNIFHNPHEQVIDLVKLRYLTIQSTEPLMKKICTLISLVCFAVALVACGGGGGGSAVGSPATTQAVSGVAIDGNLKSALVFLDLNDNGKFDTGEPNTVTDSNGAFTLNATSSEATTHSVVVSAIAGQTIDQDNPNTLITQGFTLISPPGKNDVISPITTLIVAKMSGGLSLSAAEAAVKTDLGINTLDVYKNYVVEKLSDATYQQVANIAAATAETLKTAEANNTSSSLAAKMSDVTTLFSGTVSTNLSSIKTATNSNAARELMSQLNASSNSSATSTATGTITNTNTVYNLTAGDLNGDGLEDIVISGWNIDVSTAYVYILIQNSNGTLTDQTSQLLANNVIEGNQRALIGDFDNDGRADIFLPGFVDGHTYTGAHSVMLWGSSGQFVRENWTDKNWAHGACIADMNNDGKPDLLVAGASYSSSDNIVGGVYINNGNRSFTLNSRVLSNNSFSSCAVIPTNSGNTIFFSNANIVTGYRDAIATFDYSLNQISLNAAHTSGVDTIDSFVADLDANGVQDFIVSSNGIAVNEAGPRESISSTGALLSTLESKHSFYYGRALSNSMAFFSGGSDTASVFQGLTKYKPNAFIDMASPYIDRNVAFVYKNSVQNKLYMLQLLGGVFRTREM